MLRLTPRFVALVAIVFLGGWSLRAQDQQVVVERNVYLRDQPTGSSHKIELLAPPTSLTLLESNKTGGYYHAKDANGHEGWVWAKNVHVVAPPTSTAHDMLPPLCRPIGTSLR